MNKISSRVQLNPDFAEPNRTELSERKGSVWPNRTEPFYFINLRLHFYYFLVYKIEIELAAYNRPTPTLKCPNALLRIITKILSHFSANSAPILALFVPKNCNF